MTCSLTLTPSLSPPLPIFILFLFVKQGPIYDWVQYHRLHHKTFKTVDDPYYSEKDFLHSQVFAHIRSLSPKQEYMLQQIDMTDLDDDKIIMFQKKYVFVIDRLCLFAPDGISRHSITMCNLFHLQILLGSILGIFRAIANKCAIRILG